MIKNLDFAKQSMRFNIMEGNTFAATATASYGFDVLDMHYYMVRESYGFNLPQGFFNSSIPASVSVKLH